MVCVSENEVALIVQEYLELIRGIEESTSDAEREHLEQLRLYCIGRVDQFILSGSIRRRTVDSMSQALSGAPFESAFDGMDCSVIHVPLA